MTSAIPPQCPTNQAIKPNWELVHFYVRIITPVDGVNTDCFVLLFVFVLFPASGRGGGGIKKTREGGLLIGTS